MKLVFAALAKHQPKTFKVSYSPDYKPLALQHILLDKQHPLHEVQKRRRDARKKEGLWWHVTTGADLSTSSVVRSWARRRLRNAFTEELKARGFDAGGRHVNMEAVKGRQDLEQVLKQGKSLDLVGSVRMHVQRPLIPAKYVDLKTDTGNIIEILLKGVTADIKSVDRRPAKAALSQWNPPKPPPQAPSSHRLKRPTAY